MRLQTLAVRFFLCFIGTSGSSSQTRFLQTNKDLLLMTVQEEVQIGRDIFIWKFNDNKIIRLNRGEVEDFDDYENRVEFFKQNLSLILQNVQLSDSGIYTAVVSRKREEILSTYDVIVEAPVSPVLLSVDSVFNSSESCNFTVNCTTELSPSISRSFTCDRRTCEEASPAPSDPAPSLRIYLSDVSIICNHSNHVSWRKDTEEIQQVCPLFGTKDPAEILKVTAGPTGEIVGGIFLSLCLICLIVGVVLWKRQKSQRNNMENTVYEAPELLPSRPAGGDVVESPSSIYSTVQPHTGPAPAPAQNPESLYATVNKTSTPDLLSSV